LVREKYQEEKACDKYNKNYKVTVTIIIIVIIIIPHLVYFGQLNFSKIRTALYTQCLENCWRKSRKYRMSD
jgi:hypothetical protein